LVYTSLLVIIVMAMSSCGVHHARVANLNNNVTNVELGESNYKIVGKVSGEATAKYILGIGLNKKTLTNNATSKMYQSADLEGKSRAIINVSTEEYFKTFIVYTERTVTSTGYIVEFE